MQANDRNTSTITRLTALWALCESGLGGFMHALKIPFTGIFVGGFAVIIIGLLAHYTRNNMRQVLQCTLLVMLVKFAASPQSPFPAYIAVGFQGLAGAVIYRLIPNYTIASVQFAILAMLESALQKIIVMTLIFGKSIWQALDALFKGILKDFALPPDFSFSYWLIIAYCVLYAAWGLILGIWIARLPGRIDARADTVRHNFRQVQEETITIVAPEKKKRKNKLVFIFITLTAIVLVFLLGNYGANKAVYAVIRTVAALLVLYVIINPLVKWAMTRWLEKTKSKHKEAMQPLIELMPELRSTIRPAYDLAASEHSGWRRYPAFLFNLIVITIHPPINDQA